VVYLEPDHRDAQAHLSHLMERDGRAEQAARFRDGMRGGKFRRVLDGTDGVARDVLRNSKGLLEINRDPRGQTCPKRKSLSTAQLPRLPRVVRALWTVPHR